MGINSPQSDEENDINKFELAELPDSFEKMSIPEQHRIWIQNHEKIKQLLEDNPPPFFGLHGTNTEAFGIINTTKNCAGEIATFYKKEYESEQFVFKLYHAAIYVSDYANRNQPGKILVFNLEKDGENPTIPWENLLKGSTLPIPLSCDSDDESKYFENLNKNEMHLYRSFLNLKNNDYKSRLAGAIDLNDTNITNYLPKKEKEEIGHIIMRNRFLAQAILAQTLQILATTPQCPK